MHWWCGQVGNFCRIGICLLRSGLSGSGCCISFLKLQKSLARLFLVRGSKVWCFVRVWVTRVPWSNQCVAAPSVCFLIEPRDSFGVGHSVSKNFFRKHCDIFWSSEAWTRLDPSEKCHFTVLMKSEWFRVQLCGFQAECKINVCSFLATDLARAWFSQCQPERSGC